MYKIGRVLYVRALNFRTLSFKFPKFKSIVRELQTIHIFIFIININITNCFLKHLQIVYIVWNFLKLISILNKYKV